MAKTLIDIDEVALEQAREALGTTTKRDTVNAALQRVADEEAATRARRLKSWEEMKARASAGDYDDVLDPEIMRGAWE